MIRRQLLNRIDRDCTLFIQLIKVYNASLFAHLDKLDENLCRTCRIIHRTMMIIKRHTYCLGNRIQLETIQCRKEKSCHTHRIHCGKRIRKAKTLTIFLNKSSIKPGIVSHKNRTLTKFQKLWKHHFNRRCIQHHAVVDSGQLFNSIGNRHLRIDKGGKTIGNLSMFHFHSTNLNNLTGQCTKSRCFNIKDHIGIVETLPSGIDNHSLCVIHQISFHSINNLKICLRRYTASPRIKAVICLREGLHDSMIGNGNCFVSPLIRAFYQCFGICDTIHITHFRMAVQFHALLRTGIGSRLSKIGYFLDSNDRTDGQLTVKAIDGRHTF